MATRKEYSVVLLLPSDLAGQAAAMSQEVEGPQPINASPLWTLGSPGPFPIYLAPVSTVNPKYSQFLSPLGDDRRENFERKKETEKQLHREADNLKPTDHFRNG